MRSRARSPVDRSRRDRDDRALAIVDAREIKRGARFHFIGILAAATMDEGSDERLVQPDEKLLRQTNYLR